MQVGEAPPAYSRNDAAQHIAAGGQQYQHAHPVEEDRGVLEQGGDFALRGGKALFKGVKGVALMGYRAANKKK
jgi:hypothetical protein